MTRVRAARVVLFALGLFAVGGLAAAQESRLKFEVYKDKAGEFRWRLKAGNGEILATGGQGYKQKADAKHGVESVQKASTNPKANFELYEDAKKLHRWRLKASNGQVVASSSQGYKEKATAEKAISNIKANAGKAEVTEIKD